jgi:hypothetical protein
MDDAVLGEVNDKARFQIRPLRRRELVRELSCFDRANHNAAIVVPESNSVSEPEILTVTVFHVDRRS